MSAETDAVLERMWREYHVRAATERARIRQRELDFAGHPRSSPDWDGVLETCLVARLAGPVASSGAPASTPTQETT